MPFLRDLMLSALRTVVGAAPALAGAFFIWYAKNGYTPRQHADVAGFLAVLTLSLLAGITLTPRMFPAYGRLGLTAFMIWAGTSSIWRLLSFLNLINADTRLILNSIVASTLAVLGIYVMFTHRYLMNIWHYLTQPTANLQ